MTEATVVALDRRCLLLGRRPGILVRMRSAWWGRRHRRKEERALRVGQRAALIRAAGQTEQARALYTALLVHAERELERARWLHHATGRDEELGERDERAQQVRPRQETAGGWAAIDPATAERARLAQDVQRWAEACEHCRALLQALEE
jgi:hypothetical protein